MAEQAQSVTDPTSDESAGQLPYGLLYDAMKRELCRHFALIPGSVPPLDMLEPEQIAAFQTLTTELFQPFKPEVPSELTAR